MKIRLFMAIVLLPILTFASALPEPALPASVGVNIHFIRGHEHELDMIAAAGFKFVRMDFDWTTTEPTKGGYDWSAYDELTTNLSRRGIRAYYILDYSNPLYENESPTHPAGIAAFARWAAAAARHFQSQRVVWEIWNEPNGSTFWKPKPDAAQYTALALAACKAIRKADSQATIVAPASYGFDWPFLETFLNSGVLAYLDGVSVHPYRSPEKYPETVATDYQRLHELIARCEPAGRKIPIISGEWGYPSNTKGVSLQTQSDFIARQQLFNLFSGVPVSIWYDWGNDGKNPDDKEHNFGTVTYDLKPKPAYVAIQTLTRELSGYSISGRYDTGNQADFALVLTNAEGAVKMAAWTLSKPHRVTLGLESASMKKLSWINGNNESGTVEIEENNFTSELNGTPKYITLGKVHLKHN
jgi:hypothetical protein